MQERIAEIKRISSQIASVKSDMGRFEEQLEDCRRFRDFLYKLSPEDWRQEQEQRVAAIRAKRKAAQAAGARCYIFFADATLVLNQQQHQAFHHPQAAAAAPVRFPVFF